MRNRTMCLSMVLLSSSLLFTMPTATKTPLANNIKEDANVNKIFKTDKYGLLINPIQEQFEKDKLELDKKKAEENKHKQLEERKKNEPQWQEFIVSFYTGLDEENYMGCGGKNCLNQPLKRGMIANNSLPMGTKIFLDNDYGIRTVQDKGSSRFNSDNRIDLYVAKRDNETREQWKHRAESYGIKHIWGYIIKQ